MRDKEIKISTRLESKQSSINLIEPMIADIRCRVRISDELYYNILIAATEAVNNAIIHGNKLNPSKFVTFGLSADDSSLTITVSDEGEGFDPEKVQDPRLPANLLKASGRGVFFIKRLTTSAEYSDGGRTVKMTFALK